MLECGKNWQPTELKRFVKSFPTSTCVIQIVTDQGNAFLKAMGNPSGDQSLACELVGTELAAWFGLPTLEFALIDVPDNMDLPFANNRGLADEGTAFISKEEQVIPWGGGEILLKKLKNRKDLSKLIIFDTWIRNFDRYPPENSIMEPNRDNFLFLNETGGRYSLLAADHTHAFVEGDLWGEIEDLEIISDPEIYGLAPGFHAYITREHILEATAQLRQIEIATIAEIVNSVPVEWGASTKSRDEWIAFIYERAKFVAATAPNRMFEQTELVV